MSNKLFLSVGIAIILSGCDEREMRANREVWAEQAIEDSTRHCIDGVSYIATAIHSGFALTPYLRTDGKPHTCGKQANETKR